MSALTESRTFRALKTAGPLVCVLLVCAIPFLARLKEPGPVAWRKAVKAETGSIRVSFPADVTKIRLRLGPPTDVPSLLGPAHVILAPNESGIEAYWLSPGLTTPTPAPTTTASTQEGAKKKPGSTPSKQTAGAGQNQNNDSPDPPLPPWFACGASTQKPKNWVAFCTLEENGTLLTVERSSVGTRADVWLLPVAEVSPVRVVPQTELRWTETVLLVKKDPNEDGKEVVIDAAKCTGFDETDRVRSDLPECAPVRAVFGAVAAEPVATATNALANDIVLYESRYGSGLLSMMRWVLKIVFLVCVGASAWHLKLIWSPNPGGAEAARLFRAVRWPLQWAEVVFPAVAFTLTTACLVVAFRRPQGPEGEAGFREGIGLALVATALGLVIRVLAHTADRLIENAAHHGADHDGIICAQVAKEPAPAAAAAAGAMSPGPPALGSIAAQVVNKGDPGVPVATAPAAIPAPPAAAADPAPVVTPTAPPTAPPSPPVAGGQPQDGQAQGGG